MPTINQRAGDSYKDIRGEKSILMHMCVKRVSCWSDSGFEETMQLKTTEVK